MEPWLHMLIYDTGNDFVLQISSKPPVVWYDVPVAVSGDHLDLRVFGIELFTVHQPALSTKQITKKLRKFANVSINEDGYVSLDIRRENAVRPGFGFGRLARVGIDESGDISVVQIPWNDPRTSAVDPHKALKGIAYRRGQPFDDGSS